MSEVVFVDKPSQAMRVTLMLYR